MAGPAPQYTFAHDCNVASDGSVILAGGITDAAGGMLAVAKVGADGSLTNTMLAGTYGYDDIAHLRTVPLPDGRVVLVTEKDARFLTV